MKSEQQKNSYHYKEHTHGGSGDRHNQSRVHLGCGCMGTERKSRKKKEEDKNYERVRQTPADRSCMRQARMQHKKESCGGHGLRQYHQRRSS